MFNATNWPELSTSSNFKQSDRINSFIPLSINSDSEKIRSAIYKNCGAQLAKDLFDRRGKVAKDSFDLIFWEMTPKVTNEPKTFMGWDGTTYICNFNGFNRYLSPAGNY